MTVITQAEARSYRTRLRKLERYIERQRNRWNQTWPDENGAVYLGEMVGPERLMGMVEASKKLAHPVVCTLSPDGKHLNLWADPVQAAREIEEQS